ncbi:MAG: PQQ-binding-like beta-propeller repeat protein [Planctomycetota bacterium]
MKLVRIVFVLGVLCAISALVASVVSAADWTSLGNDPARSRSTDEKLSDTFIPDWQYSIASEIISSPAVGDGVVVFAARDGSVTALRESNGILLWSSAISGDIIASPAIALGRVYIPAGGKVHCLRLTDGVTFWDFPTTSTDISSPLVLDNRLYLGLGFPNQKVIAIDVNNPTTSVWQSPTEQIVYSSPAVSGSTLVIGCDSGRYYALNKDTGAEIWTYPTIGAVLLSSPLISGTDVYLLPGGNDLDFYSIDIDNANWPVSNYSIALSDPSSGTIVGDVVATKLATSSLIRAGDYVGFTARFDYSVDTDSDTIADQYVLNEYAIAIDPLTPTASIKWQVALGTLITANQNNIPPYGLCPTMLGMKSQSGQTVLAVPASLATELRILNPANGAILWNYTLDATVQSSPVAANGRLLVATKSGTLHALRSTGNQAPEPPVAGFSPVTGTAITIGASAFTPTITWSPATDTNDASATLQYQVRLDDDGEIIESYDALTTTSAGITSVTLAQIPITGTLNLTYAIRTIDPSGAYSAWSEPQTFTVVQDITPPNPPTGLMATPSNNSVTLYWTASPSTDTAGYLVAYKEITGSFGSYLAIGNVTSYEVPGLTNGITYTFSVIAEDAVGLQSLSAEVTETPGYQAFLNGSPYATLADAVTAAQAGDTIALNPIIFVVPGTLYLRQGVSISGYAPHLTVLYGPGGATLFELTGPSVVTKGVISNLTLTGAGIGIDASSYSIEVQNAIFRQMGTGIFGNDTSDITIVNNTFISHTETAIIVAGQTNIRNNIIVRNETGIWWQGIEPDLPKLSITYNDVYGNTSDYVDAEIGIGNISVDVVFTDEAANDYREVVGSETVDMGDPADDWTIEPIPSGDRINMGAFGNTIYATISSFAGSSGRGRGVSQGCFIATAVYGNYNHPNVLVLRNFRDNCLLTNALGRRFVDLYYKISPPVAEYLKHSPMQAFIIRLALNPIVYYVKYPSIFFVFFVILMWMLYFATKALRHQEHEV